MKKVKFPVEIKRGSVSVKIYRTPSHGCESFTVAYYQDGVRKRPTFPTFEKAKAEADLVATRLGNTDADVLTLSSADRAAYLRARQVLDPLGVSIESAAVQFAHMKKLLKDVPPIHAIEVYLKRHPVEVAPQAVRDVVEEMLKAKKDDGLSAGYLQHLRYDLEKFAATFQGNIGDVSGADIDSWLRGLEVSGRTRNNLRCAVQTLLNYAKARKYLPKDHDELDAVAKAKDGNGEIEVYTPAELAEILNHADRRLIPFLTLGAFAGIRHAEIQRLDWRDIQFDAGIIEVRASKAKTASRRTVPLLDNLRAWLAPHRQLAGPVCGYRNVSNEITKLVAGINKERAKGQESGVRGQESEAMEQGFQWKHNALRHSFISYRVADVQNVAQVALEAGNSPQMIFRHYRELVRPAEAKTWFALAPGGEGKVVAIGNPEQGRRKEAVSR